MSARSEEMRRRGCDDEVRYDECKKRGEEDEDETRVRSARCEMQDERREDEV